MEVSVETIFEFISTRNLVPSTHEIVLLGLILFYSLLALACLAQVAKGIYQRLTKQ